MRDAKPWTSADQGRLLEMRGAGLSITACSLELRRSYAAVKRKLNLMGHSAADRARPSLTKWTPEMDAAVLKGIESGRSYLEIGNELGIAVPLVKGRMARIRAQRSYGAITDKEKEDAKCAVEACRRHLNDLLVAYPRGVPVAGRAAAP